MNIFHSISSRCRSISVTTLLVAGVQILSAPQALATKSESPEVLARRGTMKPGAGKEKPTLTLTKPDGGWTSARMLEVAGTCSDQTADPIAININGSRYFVRASSGTFARKFPAAPGRNNVAVECTSVGGTARAERVVHAAIGAVRMKIVLTSDTDGIYTDLHMYEPDGAHVYWASTDSPTGGLFFLNADGGSFDKPGYGPYMYVHPAPPVGTFRIDVNYWPGSAVQHTVANLDVIVDEGLPSESRRRVRKALSMPSETQTLAYVTIVPNRGRPKIFVPGQDPDSERPPEVKPKETSHDWNDGGAFVVPMLNDGDSRAVRTAVASLATQQAVEISSAWDPSQRDCAGLIRFAYREALRERTRGQRSALKLPEKLPLPSVSRPATERFGGGDFWQTGVDARGRPRFGAFADAEALIGWNFVPVGKSMAAALPGDVLAFRGGPMSGAGSRDNWHLMLVASTKPGRESVVYHNGERPGSVRVISTTELFRSEALEWRPDAQNERFLGVWRWRHLNQGTIPAPVEQAKAGASLL